MAALTWDRNSYKITFSFVVSSIAAHFSILLVLVLALIALLTTANTHRCGRLHCWRFLWVCVRRLIIFPLTHSAWQRPWSQKRCLITRELAIFRTWTVSLCGLYPVDCAAAEYVFMTISLHETIKTAIKSGEKRHLKSVVSSKHQGLVRQSAACDIFSSQFWNAVFFSNVTCGFPVLHSDQCSFFCVGASKHHNKKHFLSEMAIMLVHWAPAWHVIFCYHSNW